MVWQSVEEKELQTDFFGLSTVFFLHFGANAQLFADFLLSAAFQLRKEGRTKYLSLFPTRDDLGSLKP